MASLLRGRGGVEAQAPPTDADLERVSGTSSVRLGVAGSGPTSTLPLELYIARVLAGEGEPRASDAAQEALAIAIRTFVIANTGRHRADGFDLCETTHCQVLRQATAVTRRAALATAGQILTMDGRPVEIFYSASCGGYSEAAADIWSGVSLPYLRAVPDDVHEAEAPWRLELSLADLEATLRKGGFGGRLLDIEVAARSASGRASRLRLDGMEPEVITGEQLRALLGYTTLRSTLFTLTRTGSSLAFVGRGFGHGVGLCTIGAGRRAARGESAREILEHYFPGLDITPIAAEATRTTRVASPAAAAAVVPRRASLAVRSDNPDVETIANRAHSELSARLGVSVAPVTVEVYDTLDAFRQRTGQPWWVSVVASGTSIDLAPLPLLEQRDGVERSIRIAIADLLVADTFRGRPAWVRVGASRYFSNANASPPANASRLRCPADAELTLAVSAVAQRDAEARAEACFARELERVGDWRAVK